MPIEPKQILEALKKVEDPDLHRDIVSLGFIKNIRINGGKISFDVELTTPACPVKEQLKKECIERVQKIEGVKEVAVSMTSKVRAQVQTTLEALKEVKHIIAVASGKGGVGKSTVALNLALALIKSGAEVGLLDADIYGPSIPMMLGIAERPQVEGGMVLPVVKNGLKIISMGMLANESSPVIWRGPMVSGIIQQFLMQVRWGVIDYLVIDLPPGTGDVQLTLTQKAPISGAVIVTTPQDVALLDARRGLKMFQEVAVPVLGVVENMSYFVCDGCDKKHFVFRKGGGEKISKELNVPFLGGIPLDPAVAEGGDAGQPIVHSAPNSPIAQVYQTLAGRVAAALSVLAETQKGIPQELHLKW